MIRGYVFANQLASHDVDSMIFRKILNYNDGIFKGIELTHTAGTITVHEGTVMIAGRPVGIIDNETVNAGTDNAFCKLVLEIDLTKEASVEKFEQASLKIIKSTSNYPEVVQNNMDNGGTIYQLELAKFRTNTSGIVDFVDTRTFLDFNSIYSQITKEYRTVLAQLKTELESVKDGSSYLLKSGGTATGDFLFEKNITVESIKNKNR